RQEATKHPAHRLLLWPSSLLEEASMSEPTQDTSASDPPPTSPTPLGVCCDQLKRDSTSAAALPWLGHVTVLRSWRQGGLGEVLVGRDEQLHRDVAFKRIKAERGADADARRR